MMETIKQYKWPLVAGAIALVGVIGLIANANMKAEQAKQAEASEQKAQDESIAKKADKAAEDKKAVETAAASYYTYTARMGDSFTVLARKAVQKYSADVRAGLSQAQIIAAESQLTRMALWPELEIGEKVMLKNTDVKSVVDSVKKLSGADLAAWATYVPFVDFDTSKNG